MKGVEIQNFGEIEKCDEIINIYEQEPYSGKSIRSYEETYYPRNENTMRERNGYKCSSDRIVLEMRNVN